MKVAVIGSNGQLGSDIVNVLSLKHELIPLTHREIEIGDEKNTRDVLKTLNPEVIINTAAFHNVPKCEEDKGTAFKINGYAMKHLSIISNELNAYLLHISTDYVFDGLKKEPYREEDIPNPLNTYGISKYVGEIYIRNYCEYYAIIRVSGLYGMNPCRAKSGKNFIDNVISMANEGKELKIVDDQILTPTYTYYVALQIEKIIERKINGIIHSTCEGEVSWYEFTKEIFRILNLDVKIEPVKTKKDELVKRPLYSVLENSVLKREGINIMPLWKDALREYINNKYKIC